MATQLSPRLQVLLAQEPEKDLAARLKRIFEAATRSVARLGELEASEPELVDDAGPDLSVYERVAPSVALTLAEMNGLLQTLRLLFPADELQTEPRGVRIDGTVQAAAAHLQIGIAGFAETMRDPRVVSDAWELLQQLQTHRQRFRETVGALVFDLASALGECRRDEVEPGHLEALDQALRLRVATTDLRRLLAGRHKLVLEAAPEDVEWNFAQLKKDLLSFQSTVTWAALRAHDRKHLRELMTRLDNLVGHNLRQADLLTALKPLLEFAERFADLSRRELLANHDREVLAACGVLLERAQSALRHQPVEALHAFGEALGRGAALYGRSADFDALLWEVQVSPATPATLGPLVDRFLAALAGFAEAG